MSVALIFDVEERMRFRWMGKMRNRSDSFRRSTCGLLSKLELVSWEMHGRIYERVYALILLNWCEFWCYGAPGSGGDMFDMLNINSLCL